MIPPEVQKRLEEVAGTGNPFAITSLVAIVDGRIPDKAFRLRDLIGACSWRGPCPLTFEDMAAAVHSSRSQVIRHIKILDRFGYVIVTRRRNRCNLYSVPPREGKASAKPEIAPEPSAPAKATVECPKCKKQRAMLLRAGHCRSCGWKLKIRRIVREEIGAVQAKIA